MQIRNLGRLALCVGAISLGSAFADTWDKKTVITIDAPMQLPTVTLQPGSYTFKLLESQSNRHIVAVWDKDGKKHVTTVLAIPNYRLRPTGKSTFTTWETPQGQPAALRAWFYPGDNFGQEFAYPKDKAQQIAAISKTEVPTLSTSDESRIAETRTETETATARSTETATAPPAEAPTAPPAAAEPVAAAPVAAAPVTTTPAAPEQPARQEVAVAQEPEPKALPADQGQTQAMPQTASEWATVTLLGMLTAIFAVASLRKPKARIS